MATAAEDTTSRPLFGGALQIALPGRFEDVSNFRDVPSHQEIFADADTDQSVIVEINSYSDIADDGAARYFWDDLADAGEAFAREVAAVGTIESKAMPLIPPEYPRLYSSGTQLISKYRETKEAANDVMVYVAAIRLRKYGSDLLIIFNFPIKVSPKSATASKRVLPASVNEAVIRSALASFTVLDWDLFGPPDPSEPYTNPAETAAAAAAPRQEEGKCRDGAIAAATALPAAPGSGGAPESESGSGRGAAPGVEPVQEGLAQLHLGNKG